MKNASRSFVVTRLCATLASACVLAACSGAGPDEAALLASAKTYLDKQDHAAAVIQLKTVLQKSPDNAQARLLLGRSLLESGDAATASVELQKALSLGVNPSQVQPLLAQAMLAQGEMRQVVQKFVGVHLDDAEASADMKTTVATAFAALKERDKALETVQSALKEWPGHIPASLLLARIKASDGDVPGALALVDQVLAVDAKHQGALLFKGELQRYGQRDRDAAMTTFTQAVQAHPKAVAAHEAIIDIEMSGAS